MALSVPRRDDSPSSPNYPLLSNTLTKSTPIFVFATRSDPASSSALLETKQALATGAKLAHFGILVLHGTPDLQPVPFHRKPCAFTLAGKPDCADEQLQRYIPPPEEGRQYVAEAQNLFISSNGNAVNAQGRLLLPTMAGIYRNASCDDGHGPSMHLQFAASVLVENTVDISDYFSTALPKLFQIAAYLQYTLGTHVLLVNEDSRHWMAPLIQRVFGPNALSNVLWVGACQRVHAAELLFTAPTFSPTPRELLVFARNAVRDLFLPAGPESEANAPAIVFAEAHPQLAHSAGILTLLGEIAGSKNVLHATVSRVVPWDDTVTTFARARVIIGYGSALAHVLWCSPGSTVIELASPVEGVDGLQTWHVANSLNLSYYRIAVTTPSALAVSLSAAFQASGITAVAPSFGLSAARSWPASSEETPAQRDCVAGTYRYGDHCSECPAGTYRRHGPAEACTPCPPGMFAADAGAAACRLCPPGTFSNGYGSTSCSPCASHGSLFGQTTCHADKIRAAAVSGAYAPASPTITSTISGTATLTRTETRTTTLSPTTPPAQGAPAPAVLAETGAPAILSAPAFATLPPAAPIPVSTDPPVELTVPSLPVCQSGTCELFADISTPSSPPSSVPSPPTEHPTVALRVLSIDANSIVVAGSGAQAASGAVSSVSMGNKNLAITEVLSLSGPETSVLTVAGTGTLTMYSTSTLVISVPVTFSIAVVLRGTMYSSKPVTFTEELSVDSPAARVLLQSQWTLSDSTANFLKCQIITGDGVIAATGSAAMAVDVGCTMKIAVALRRTTSSRTTRFLPAATGPTLSCCGTCATTLDVGAYAVVTIPGCESSTCSCSAANTAASITALTLSTGSTLKFSASTLDTLGRLLVNGTALLGQSASVDVSIANLPASLVTREAILVTAAAILGSVATVVVNGLAVTAVVRAGNLLLVIPPTASPPAPQPASPPAVPLAPVTAPSAIPVAVSPTAPPAGKKGSSLGLIGLSALAVVPVIGVLVVFLALRYGRTQRGVRTDTASRTTSSVSDKSLHFDGFGPEAGTQDSDSPFAAIVTPSPFLGHSMLDVQGFRVVGTPGMQPSGPLSSDPPGFEWGAVGPVRRDSVLAFNWGVFGDPDSTPQPQNPISGSATWVRPTPANEASPTVVALTPAMDGGVFYLADGFAAQTTGPISASASPLGAHQPPATPFVNAQWIT
eukprot:TRINITY_DN8620_c0_g1_i1.p1 TRINITY_DN8620_c0_g1~~TRINITY_DN8620_c0_g1_i1.p1  ORF type:complete len:1201 (+),score=139.07 TRINITY_DN8620_c0_g1_i1:22-3603(+)